MINPTKLIDIRQTAEYAKFMALNGWEVSGGQHHQPYVYSKKIPCTPFQTAKRLRYHLRHVTTEKTDLRPHALIFKDEPFTFKSEQNTYNGSIYFHQSTGNTWPLTPTKTVWIDLTQPLQIIKQKLKAKTRYNLKRTRTKFGIQISIYSGVQLQQQDQQSTLDHFYQLWSTNKPHTWLFKPSMTQITSMIKAFKLKIFLITATLPKDHKQVHELGDNPIIASALVIHSPNMAFYWHNASTDLGKQLFAPTRIVWEAIKESKKRDLQIFDFEGVWDERYPKLNPGWRGFSKFKHSFVNHS